MSQRHEQPDASSWSTRAASRAPGALPRRKLWLPLAAAAVSAATTAIVVAGTHSPATGSASSSGGNGDAAGESSATKVGLADSVGPLDTSGFATGSCIALGPTSGNRHRTVFVDAGHGGPDPGSFGATGNGTSIDEKVLTLPVAIDAATNLRAKGYRVVLSRTTDSSVAKLGPGDTTAAKGYTTAGDHADLLARVRCANLAQASVLVSVHFNAFDDPRAKGVSTLYDSERTFSADNKRFASLLQRDIVTAFADAGTTMSSRGVVSDSEGGGGEQTSKGSAYGHVDLLGPANPGYLDNPTTMPGALIEPLFITNPVEADMANSSTGQHIIASGITKAVGDFLGG